MKVAEYEAAVRKANSRMAHASRRKHYGEPLEVDVEKVARLRQELQAARLALAIQQALEPEEPFEPLGRDDRVRLAAMLVDDEGML